jgi:shikimate kinase
MELVDDLHGVSPDSVRVRDVRIQIVLHLLLIGYRGSGKTTVGEVLAGRLGRAFVDADGALEADAGRTITQIFATEGEAGFRDRESATLRKLIAGPPGVIATGGGVILRPENRDLLRSSGFVVWLTADAEQLWHRISTDPTTGERRPNLTATGGVEEVRALLAAREPLYHETAHLIVNAARSPEAIVADILPAWEAWLRSRHC